MKKPALMHLDREGNNTNLFKLDTYQNPDLMAHYQKLTNDFSSHGRVSLEINTNFSLAPLYAQVVPNLFAHAHRHVVFVDDQLMFERVVEYYETLQVKLGEEAIVVNLDGLNLEDVNLRTMIVQEFNNVPVGDELPRYAIINLASVKLNNIGDRFPVVSETMFGTHDLEGKDCVFAFANVFVQGIDGLGIKFDLEDSTKFFTTTVNEQENQEHAPLLVLIDLTDKIAVMRDEEGNAEGLTEGQVQ